MIQSAARVVPHGWPWHFFVCDRNGNRAAIEYIHGRLVVHTGLAMPVAALCNDTYQSALAELGRYQGFGGRRRLSLTDPKIPRFVWAAKMLSDDDPESGLSAVDYCFSILKNLSGTLTRRSYVVDLRNRVIYFRTGAVPQIRHFRLEALDFGSATPVLVLDLNVRDTGDVTGRFEPYTLDANCRVAEGWVRHVQEMFPNAGEAQRLEGGYSSTQVDRNAQYPETSLARSDLATGRNRYGLTPLHWAALRGELDLAARLVAEGAQASLKSLCRAYWRPLYAYIRRRGYSPQDAADLTQDFFYRLFERQSLTEGEPKKGRFRSFLLAAMNHSLSDAWDKARAMKRGSERVNSVKKLRSP